jgi:hypothetical protein
MCYVIIILYYYIINRPANFQKFEKNFFAGSDLVEIWNCREDCFTVYITTVTMYRI